MLINHKFFFLSISVTRRDPMHHFSNADRRQILDLYKLVSALPMAEQHICDTNLSVLFFFFNRNIFCEVVCIYCLWGALNTQFEVWIFLYDTDCIKFWFIEAKYTFSIHVDQISYCEGWQHFWLWLSKVVTFLILNKCMKPLTSEGI